MMAGRGALPYEGNPGQSVGNPGQPEFASPRSGTRTFRCLSRSAPLPVCPSQGLISSRDIERSSRENVLFIAVTGDAKPHFTTIADFLSRSREAIAAACNGDGGN